MDKLQFPPAGGYYFSPDDIEFEQASYRAVVTALITPIAKLANGYMILSGLEITENGSNYEISAGYVVWDYEIRYCPPAIVNSAAIFVIVPDDSDEPNGEKELANGTVYNAWKRRRAKIAVNTLNGITLAEQNRYASLVREMIDNAPTSQTYLFGQNGYNQPTQNPLRAIAKGKDITLVGNINVGVLGQNFTLIAAALPIAYRPLHYQCHVVPFFNSGLAMLEIKPTGEISIKAVGEVNVNEMLVLHVPEIKYRAQ